MSATFRMIGQGFSCLDELGQLLPGLEWVGESDAGKCTGYRCVADGTNHWMVSVDGMVMTSAAPVALLPGQIEGTPLTDFGRAMQQYRRKIAEATAPA